MASCIFSREAADILVVTSTSQQVFVSWRQLNGLTFGSRKVVVFRGDNYLEHQQQRVSWLYPLRSACGLSVTPLFFPPLLSGRVFVSVGYDGGNPAVTMPQKHTIPTGKRHVIFSLLSISLGACNLNGVQRIYDQEFPVPPSDSHRTYGCACSPHKLSRKQGINSRGTRLQRGPAVNRLAGCSNTKTPSGPVYVRIGLLHSQPANKNKAAYPRSTASAPVTRLSSFAVAHEFIRHRPGVQVLSLSPFPPDPATTPPSSLSAAAPGVNVPRHRRRCLVLVAVVGVAGRSGGLGSDILYFRNTNLRFCSPLSSKCASRSGSSSSL